MSISVLIDLAARARIERNRLAEFLDAADAVRVARDLAGDDGLSEAGEFLALEKLDAAEGHLLALVLAPDFTAYQRELMGQLDRIAAGSAA